MLLRVSIFARYLDREAPILFLLLFVESFRIPLRDGRSVILSSLSFSFFIRKVPTNAAFYECRRVAPLYSADIRKARLCYHPSGTASRGFDL